MFMVHIGDLICAHEEEDHPKVQALMELIGQNLMKVRQAVLLFSRLCTNNTHDTL